MIVVNLITWTFVSWVWAYSQPNNFLQIDFLNVGQGDAILIRTPDNHYALIDGGRNNMVIDELSEVIPFFEHKLDLVIATHADADHIGGIVPVLERYQVNRMVLLKQDKQSVVYERVQKLISDKQINTSQINSTQDFRLGCCVEFDVVWPQPDTDVFNLETNEASVGLVIKYGKLDVYAGGDAASEIEDNLIAEIGDVDVLKVGHHGSKNSSSTQFLSGIDPEWAIISAGKGNSYGHPHHDVIKRLQELSINFWTTIDDGRLTLTSDGEKMWLKGEQMLERIELKL